MQTLTIGDRSKDGLLEIVDTNTAPDNSRRVTVRELIGHKCWVGGTPVQRMRRLGRRAVDGRVSSGRVVNRFTAHGSDHVTFAFIA